MRICFVSRRFFPAISGMSVYALNLLRELVAAGHDVTMISQYRGDALGIRVYGGGPPPRGARGARHRAGAGGRAGWRRLRGGRRHHEGRHPGRARAPPFDILHAQYGYPCGWAALEASRETGVPNVVSIQGGDGHWVGSCCETHRLAMVRVLDHAGAVLIGCRSFADEVTHRLGTDPARFTIVPGAVDVARFTPGAAPPAPAGAAVPRPGGRAERRAGHAGRARAARREGVAFELLVSGIGPTFDETAARIAPLGLGGTRG